jgi:hypothetical protein
MPGWKHHQPTNRTVVDAILIPLILWMVAPVQLLILRLRRKASIASVKDAW